MIKYIAIIGIALGQAILPSANAADTKPSSEHGSSGHSHFTKIPDKIDDLWVEIKKQQEKLTSVVAKRDLGEAHDHAFAIRDLVKALPGKVPTGLRAKAEESSKAITKIAADIDKSAAAKAQRVTEENVKKMDTAVSALRTAMNDKR